MQGDVCIFRFFSKNKTNSYVFLKILFQNFYKIFFEIKILEKKIIIFYENEKFWNLMYFKIFENN